MGRKLGGQIQASEAQLIAGLAAIRKADEDLGQKSKAVTIEADPETPWSQVVHVIDESRKLGYQRVWFNVPRSEGR